MQISVQSGGPEELYGIAKTYEIIKSAGFDGVDVNLDHLFPCQSILQKERSAVFDGPEEAFLARLDEWKSAAEIHGLSHCQAHAPFPSSVANDPEYNVYLLECLKKTIRGAAYIGCKRLVVHPFFNFYQDRMTKEEEWALNIQSYSALIETARQYDVIICLENMFVTNRGKVYAACCSDIDEACRYIDELNRIAGERRFGFCLDTGHALLCGLDLYDTMVKLGDRLEAFHIHDNNGTQDLHLAPYMGIMDWQRFVQGLQAIGFEKPLSFETFGIWLQMDAELCPDMMAMIAKTGRLFESRCR